MGKITAVYLAAGVSSRFGGRIKALAKVGPNNEPMMGVSMEQAKQAGFDNFVIIAGDKTLEPLKNEFKDSFKSIPVSYCVQSTPKYRKKPFGTTQALLSAKELVNGPFIVLNSDDLYGKETLKIVYDSLKSNKDSYCVPGYFLKNVLPEQGTVNRGVIKEKDGSLEKIEEEFNISVDDIPDKFTGEELISMNLFALQSEFFDFAEKDFNEFLESNKDDPVTECLLPDTITKFIKQNSIKMKVIPTEDKPLSITNPEDEAKVKKQLE